MKRIIALVLVAVMAALALVSCTETPATTEPAGTTPAGTTTPEKSEAPATTEPAGTPTPTPTEEDPEPTETEPAIPDPFKPWGGFEAQWGTGNVYGNGYETWPFMGNGQYCPRAFWQLCVYLDMEEADFTENVNSPTDYKYVWKLWFKDTDEDPYVYENWKGPYTAFLETTVGIGESNMIYRLQTSDCPEGDPCKDFELGKNYDVIIQVLNGEEPEGFFMVTIPWNSRVDAEYKVYNDFWKNRDRDAGYATADQTITDADNAFAADLGFTVNANGGIDFAG